MSNGAISLLITFLMKFEEKKLQQNKKYNHPQFSIIWCSSSFLLAEVCRGGRTVQIIWERFNLWLFQTEKSPILRRLPPGPCRHFYKERYSLLCLRGDVAGQEAKIASEAHGLFLLRASFQKKEQKPLVYTFPKPLGTTPGRERVCRGWAVGEGAWPQSPKTGSIQAACPITEKTPERTGRGTHRATVGNPLDSPMPQGEARATLSPGHRRPCQMNRWVSAQQYLASKDRLCKDQVGSHYRTWSWHNLRWKQTNTE